MHGHAHRDSHSYSGLAAIAAPCADPLPEPPTQPAALPFAIDSLSALREFVSRRAAAAGLSPDRTSDLLVAVSELAANSVRHAGGEGVLRVWQERDVLICEVRDGGHIAQPLGGRVRPTIEQTEGFGLWLVNQLCDLVQIRSFASGSTVRLHMRRA